MGGSCDSEYIGETVDFRQMGLPSDFSKKKLFKRKKKIKLKFCFSKAEMVRKRDREERDREIDREREKGHKNETR